MAIAKPKIEAGGKPPPDQLTADMLSFVLNIGMDFRLVEREFWLLKEYYAKDRRRDWLPTWHWLTHLEPRTSVARQTERLSI